MRKQSKNVLIISDGIAGHFRQSEGVVTALNTLFEVHELWITPSLKNGIYRYLLKSYINRGRFPVWLLKLAYKNLTLPHKKPDIIIGAGGKSLYAVAILAHYYQAKSIFTGSLRGLNPNVFDIIFTLDAYQHPHYVRLDVAPMPITLESLQLAQQQWLEKYQLQHPSSNVYALLIGGDGAGLYYKDQDWMNLASMINQIAQQHQVQWLITTSRRTPKSAEHILQQHLNPSSILQSVYWHQQPQKVIQAYLAISDRIFVTAESMTMITEAIYSSKNVTALLPQEDRTIHPSHQQHLNQLVKNHYIQLKKTTELSNVVDKNTPKAQSSSFLMPVIQALNEKFHR